MEFDFFKLHNQKQDNNLRKCIRLYGVLEKYSESKKQDKILNQTIFLNKKLKEIDQKLRVSFGSDWKKEWIKKMPYKIKETTLKDWFMGRASLPIMAIEKLYYFKCKKDVKEIINTVEYFSSTTQEIIKLPKIFDKDLSYLTGLILGDGCLPNIFRKKEKNFEYKTIITSGDKIFIEKEILKMIKKVFEKHTYCKINKKNHFELELTNKTMFRFFTKIIKIHSGKKAINARIPKLIFKSSKEKQIAFLAGLIDSDIGKHGNGMGSTFRSELFVEDLVKLTNLLGIKTKKGGTYIIKEKYPQTDFTIPKSEVKTLKRLLYKNYLPKRKDRLKTINLIAGVG
jgi:hypothetical protein